MNLRLPKFHDIQNLQITLLCEIEYYEYLGMRSNFNSNVKCHNISRALITPEIRFFHSLPLSWTCLYLTVDCCKIWGGCSGRISSGQVDCDFSSADGLEDSDGFGVGEAVGGVTVHRKNFIPWKTKQDWTLLCSRTFVKVLRSINVSVILFLPSSMKVP